MTAGSFTQIDWHIVSELGRVVVNVKVDYGLCAAATAGLHHVDTIG